MHSAVYIELSDVVFDGCTFSGNSGPFGAIYGRWGSPLITECTFTLNSADSGACMGWDSSGVEISQCTFAANSGTDGSVLWTRGGLQPTVYSCILAFNTGAVPVYCMDGPPSLACCDIYGNDSGDWVGCIASQFGNDGNIRMDPLFCDPDSGDFTLQLESPCMADSAPPGCPRIGAHDVGCTGGADVPRAWQGETIFLSQPSPNPASTAMRISFAIPSSSELDRTRVRVFDVAGRLVRELIDGKMPTGKLHQVTWDGRDEKGRQVSSGIYYVRLESGGEGMTVKAVFAR
jgi:hypothetical protein